MSDKPILSAYNPKPTKGFRNASHTAQNSLKDETPLPCPHGRQPMGGYHGWRHCPHCLGTNNLNLYE
jgi:hypothetical protein